MIKKKTPQQISKSQLKAKYKGFWTSWKWIPGRSPEVWTDLLNNSRNSRDSMLYALKGAVTKLSLEKKITLEQKENLTKMLLSSDRESNYLAICLMQQIAPKRFLRKNQKDTISPEHYRHIGNTFRNF